MNEMNNEAVQDVRILRSPEEVYTFVENCKTCLEAYPKYAQQLYYKAMHVSRWSRDDYADGLYGEIQKLTDTVGFTICNAEKGDGYGISPLAGNQECMDALKGLSKDIRKVEEAIDFAVSLAETLYAFRCLANGFHPDDDALEVDDALMRAEMELVMARKDAEPLDDAQEDGLLD